MEVVPLALPLTTLVVMKAMFLRSPMGGLVVRTGLMFLEIGSLSPNKRFLRRGKEGGKQEKERRTTDWKEEKRITYSKT